MPETLIFTLLLLTLTITACRPAEDPSTTEGAGAEDAPADLLEMIDGRGIQWGRAWSRDAWAQMGSSASIIPRDSLSYVGTSKAYLPGARHDIYYIAVAGPSSTVGQVLCEASADITLAEVPGFARAERVMLTVVWGSDTCGWNVSGDVYEQVTAWVDATQTLHLWEPSTNYPANSATLPDENDDETAAAFKLCTDPTIMLTGRVASDHPASVCDPGALFGAGNYVLSTEPSR